MEPSYLPFHPWEQRARNAFVVIVVTYSQLVRPF